MFLGGNFLDVELCENHSYKDLGLKSILCSEDVDLKNKEILDKRNFITFHT